MAAPKACTRFEQEKVFTAIVAGVDFGTLSVRVTIVDTGKGRLGTGIGEYPLHRKEEDPNHSTQSHVDHMRALGEAVQMPSLPLRFRETKSRPSR
jgi:ribulose kinase